MAKRRNTRINTMFSEIIFDWVQAEADERGQSLAQVVRDKVDLAKRDETLIQRIDHLEAVIRKSHALLIKKLGGES